MINRYEWAKAVRKADLPDRAKTVSAALAYDFANAETGQCNPSVETLAAHLCVSTDTIKRAIGDLEAAGWLGRAVGRWRGQTTSYTLLSPGNVVALTVKKGGQQSTPNPVRKGGSTAQKGGQYCTPHIKQEQSKEHRASANDARPVPQVFVIHHGNRREAAWNEWLQKNGWPSLRELNRPISDGEGTGWDMPLRLPPSADHETENRIAEKYLSWAVARMIERREKSDRPEPAQNTRGVA